MHAAVTRHGGHCVGDGHIVIRIERREGGNMAGRRVWDGMEDGGCGGWLTIVFGL
jgi:hypothetical protein